MATVTMMIAVIPSLPRAELARLTERMIDRLDQLDGDSDVELNGDELDGSGCAEDEFMRHGCNGFEGPGCPLSDPGEEDDPPGDALDWGELDDSERLGAPVYGIDQSAGPTTDNPTMAAFFRTHVWSTKETQNG